ncbi:hypothetical protein [Candidatus Palauibacter sp.]|uniref:hypothetical protein n=1 Tax=Candidatus Palauibacter sp. TaxID=3101350 RepID=UPI003B01816F
MLELIETARELAGGTPHRPRQADLRCAVSAAYYALFHCMMRTCADSFIGTAGAQRSHAAWQQVYRALDHGSCKNRCKEVDRFGFPQPILDFANVFIEMQEKRHRADYHPSPSLIRNEVMADIEDCERAIGRLESSKRKDKRAFAAFVLFPRRA